MPVHRPLLASVLVLAAFCACARPPRTESVAPATPQLGVSAPGMPRADRMTLTAPRRSDVSLYAPAALVEALGLTPLRTAVLGDAEREIRAWPAVSIGIPKQFVRVVDRGATATAESYLYWRDQESLHSGTDRPSFEVRMREERGCGPIQHANGFGFCVLASAQPERARALVAYLDSIGAWRAADEDPVAMEEAAGQSRIQIDGSHVAVEVRRGHRYDGAVYYNRHMKPGSIGELLYDLPSRF